MSRRHKAAAWLLDYLYVAGRQFSHRVHRAPPAEYREGTRRPVVLIPGVYETWHYLRPIADRLNAAGHPVHAITALGRNRGPVVAMAGIVYRYLDEHSLGRAILVAHSKGGLIGKHVMAIDDAAGRVDQLIAINTPFAGSVYARYLPLRSLRAFVPGEATLVMLGAELEINSRITSIFAEFDPHIPAGSALQGATNIRVPALGHFRPLASSVVIDAVLAAAASENPNAAHTAPGVD